MEGSPDQEVEVKAGVGKHGARKATVTSSSNKLLGGHGKKKQTRKTVASQVTIDAMSEEIAVTPFASLHIVIYSCNSVCLHQCSATGVPRDDVRCAAE